MTEEGQLSVEHRRRLLLKAQEIRERTVRLTMRAGGHIGGDLSETDILVNLYDYMRHDPGNPYWVNRDRFVLSKGHSAEAYYMVLADHGYISDEEIGRIGSFRAQLGGHPTKDIPGIEASTGSLGHGLGIAAGMAYALRLDSNPAHVYVMTGDGELAEGSIWEAAMFAASKKLSSLTWIIDRNHLQISGPTEEVMPLENLNAKVSAFGFHTVEIDGHDMDAIRESISLRVPGQPVCVIAHTVKGKGLPVAEGRAEWHHKKPDIAAFEEMLENLDALRKSIIQGDGRQEYSL